MLLGLAVFVKLVRGVEKVGAGGWKFTCRLSLCVFVCVCVCTRTHSTCTAKTYFLVMLHDPVSQGI